MEVLSLKERKEAFVTGHDGGTPWEVLLVCFSAPIGLACYRSFTATVKPKATWVFVAFEAALVWFPMVLCQTNYLYPYGIIMLLSLSRIGHIFGFSGRADEDEQGRQGSAALKLDYLTAYRSSILYLTFIAILAVDFHVFPRRFCKTEVSGFGLMDVGAASFCLSAGLVSPRARGKNHPRTPAASSASSMAKRLFHTLPLVLLGFVRIVTNRELEYQEHVSEYGVHWNFFFTMGILALVPPLLAACGESGPSWWKPAIIMSLYQVALSYGGLQDFIETAPRQCPVQQGGTHDGYTTVLWWTACNIFAANREGILGCLGYLSLYFVGEWVGYKHVWRSYSSSWLWALAVLLWTLLACIYWGLGIPVSRRSTNLPFCIWAAAHNFVMLAFLQWTMVQSATSTTDPTCIPIVWDTVNRYGLLMFLIANLLTGLINLTVPTLEMSDPAAVLIVFVYICSVGMASILLDTIWKRWKDERKHKAD
jgi:glucosaminylphosphatidylinositol acyltransferase